MSSFAKTKCPNCGAIKSHHLGGWGFYGNETTNCTCGYTYQNVPNCIEDILDRDDDPPVVSHGIQNLSVATLQSRLSVFTTEELERELKRRRG